MGSGLILEGIWGVYCVSLVGFDGCWILGCKVRCIFISKLSGSKLVSERLEILGMLRLRLG